MAQQLIEGVSPNALVEQGFQLGRAVVGAQPQLLLTPVGNRSKAADHVLALRIERVIEIEDDGFPAPAPVAGGRDGAAAH